MDRIRIVSAFEFTFELKLCFNFQQSLVLHLNASDTVQFFVQDQVQGNIAFPDNARMTRPAPMAVILVTS